MFLLDTDVLGGMFVLTEAERRGLKHSFELLSLNESATMSDARVASTSASLARSLIDFAHLSEGIPLTASLSFEAVASPVSEESRDGLFAINLQAQRYQLLLTLIEAAWVGNWTADARWLLNTLRPVARMFDSGLFPLTLPFEQPEIPSYHQPLMQTLIFYLRQLREQTRSANIGQGSEDQQVASEVDTFLNSIIPVVVQLMADVFIAVQSDPASPAALEDLDSVVSAISGLMTGANSQVATAVCLKSLVNKGLVLRSCEMVARPNIANPSVLKSITRLHWAVSQSTAGAEHLSAQGVLRGYAGTTLLQNVSIHPSILDEDKDAQVIWTTMLSVARSLLQILPYTVDYVANDILPFVNSMHRRIHSALDWYLEGSRNDVNLLVQLGEVHSILEILLHVARDVEVDLKLSKQMFSRYSQLVLGYLLSAASALTRPQVVRMRVVQTLGFEKRTSNETTDPTVERAIDSADDSVLQALLVSSSSAVALLSEWMSISSAFTRSHLSGKSRGQPSRLLPQVSHGLGQRYDILGS